MKTKEETLKDLRLKHNYATNILPHEERIVFPAMDIYAKQEAIGFAEWIDKQEYIQSTDKSNWHKFGTYEGNYTTEQLYNLYKQQ